MPGPLRDDLETDVDLLQSLLKYHIVPKRLPSKSLDQQNEVQSLEGSILHVNLYLKSDFYKVILIIIVFFFILMNKRDFLLHFIIVPLGNSIFLLQSVLWSIIKMGCKTKKMCFFLGIHYCKWSSCDQIRLGIIKRHHSLH